MNRLLLFGWALLAASGLIAAEYDLVQDRTGLTLRDDGTVAALTDPASGTVLARTPAGAGAWSFRFEDAEVPVTPESYPMPQVGVGDDGIEFKWEKPDMPTVWGRVWSDPELGHWHFQITIGNFTNRTIVGAAYPAELEVPAKPGNYAVVPGDTRFMTTLKPLDALKDFSVMHPGYMQMQMSGFKIGPAALLAYTDDPETEVKYFGFSRSGDQVKFKIEQGLRISPYSRGNAGYETVFCVIPDGGYNEIAAEYGKWARRQSWAQLKTADKARLRPSLERILSDGLVRGDILPSPWALTNRTETLRQLADGRYEYIPDNPYRDREPFFDYALGMMDRYEKVYGIHPGYWVSSWWGSFYDTKFPLYFPMPAYMGDFDRFRSQMTQAGRPVLYHINPVIWDTSYPIADDPRYQLSWKGSPSKVSDWSNVTHVFTNLTESIDFELEHTFNHIRDAEGGCESGAYLDLLGHTYAADDGPYCAYPGTANSYQRSKVDAFRKVRAAITGPMMTEMCNEVYAGFNDISFGNVGIGNPEDKFDEASIPLWQLVYGDVLAWQPVHSDIGFANRNLCMSVGGIAAPPRWEDSGENGAVYAETTQQRAMRRVVTERMSRYDIVDGVGISNWPSGIFFWNRNSAADPALDLNYDSAGHGCIELEGLRPGGGVLLTDTADFSAEGVRAVRRDGKEVYREDSGRLLVVRAGDRLVIHNPTGETVRTRIALSGPLALPEATLNGMVIPSRREVTFNLDALELAPGQFLVAELRSK